MIFTSDCHYHRSAGRILITLYTSQKPVIASKMARKNLYYNYKIAGTILMVYVNHSILNGQGGMKETN